MGVLTQVVNLAAGPVEYRVSDGDTPLTPERTVLLFHGAHMSAALPLGERSYADAGYRVVSASRPGYGRTPVASGKTRASWADTMADLCAHLGLDEVAAAVGVSHGGPSAVTMAARHPRLVRSLILECALSSLPWPDLMTRLAASVGFGRALGPWVWYSFRLQLQLDPAGGLERVVEAFSTCSGRRVVAGWTPQERDEMRRVAAEMDSRYGFVHDLHQQVSAEDETAISQPTLVIATRNDGQLPFSHAERLATAIPNATLHESPALSHFVWFGPGAEDLRAAIAAHLRAHGATPAASRGSATAAAPPGTSD